MKQTDRDAEGFRQSETKGATFRRKYLAQVSIKQAFARPSRPDKAQSLAVDARQELDLKVLTLFLFCHIRIFSAALLPFCSTQWDVLSLSVDAQVGCSFTRFLTRNMLHPAQQRFGRHLRVISYGPCQTPTLRFCTERHIEIQKFVPRQYRQLTASVRSKQGSVQVRSVRGRMFDRAVAQKALKAAKAI